MSKFSVLARKLSRKGVRDPKALAATIGRKKLGKKEFQRRAAAGRRKESEIVMARKKKDMATDDGGDMGGGGKADFMARIRGKRKKGKRKTKSRG